MDVRAKVRRFLSERLLRGRPLADDAALWDEGLIDSVGLLYLLHFLEKELDVRVPQKDVNLTVFKSVDSIVSYVRRRKER